MAAVCLKDWQTLRQAGHTGIAIEHYCMDRMGFSSLTRFFKQLHLYKQGSYGHLAEVPGTLELLNLMEWIVVTPCAMHDAQNAFRWAMRALFKDKLLLRDCYVGIESLRNSWDLLTGHLALWITKRIAFRPSMGDNWCSQRAKLWDALGLKDELTRSLTFSLQLEFVDGRLLINETMLEEDPNIIATIEATLLDTWRFQKFTESRWLTVGASARSLVAGFLTGLPDLVEEIKEDPNASLFYINGFSRLTPDRMHFMVQAAIVAWVPESVLAELMIDPRVALRYQDLWLALAKNMQWLVSIPMYVWAALSSVAGISPSDLLAGCVEGGHIAFHFSGGVYWNLQVSFPGASPGGTYTATSLI